MDSSTVGEWYLQYKKKNLPAHESIEKLLFNRITAYEPGETNACTHNNVKKKTIKTCVGKSHDKKKFFLQIEKIKITINVLLFLLNSSFICI